MHTGLIAFELVSRINQVPIDTRALVREYGLTESELTAPELLRIAKGLGFKAKLKKLSLKQLFMGYPMPAIVLLRDGSFATLLKLDMDSQKALVYLPVQGNSQSLSFEEFDALSSGRYIVLKHRKITANIKFGFMWFYAEILKYRRVLVEVMLGSFMVQLFGLVTPLFTQVILDKVIVNQALNTLNVMAMGFVAIALFEFLLNITRNYIFIHTANKIDAKLGAKLFKHLFSLPFVYFESRKVGTIVARVRELDSIREFITNRSVTVIIDLVFSVVFLGMMLIYSPTLSLLVLGFVSLIALLYLIITPALRARLKSKFEMAAQSNSYLVEAVTGIQTVKSLAIEGTMQRKWEDYLGDYLKSSFKLTTMGTVALAFSNLLQKGISISVLYMGVGMVLNHQLSVGQLIAFQMFANQMTNPVLRLVNLWNDFQQTLLGVDRLGDILNHPVEVQTNQAITLPSLQGNIKFDNISFRYTPDSPYVLHNVSFEIPQGVSIGIVGRSGSGKSTITKLIQRLYLPQEGMIFMDGVDSRHMNPLWLRHNIGIVLQENYLFSGTLRENIALPSPDAPIERIIQAAKLAGADEFISQMPEGYDTFVGERGSTLSGGQRQRIAIARALITDPRILIFDEATSALDVESERIIQTNLQHIRKGRTVIIITHRLSTVQDCDIIMAMDQGKIIEMGSHQALLAKRGYYYKLVQQQQEPVRHAQVV